MPFEITASSDYILTRIFGAVTPADLHALAEEMAAVEARHPAANRLTDLTGVESFNFDFTAVSALAERRRRVEFPAPLKLAIVAVKPVAVGFTRMFQTLNDNPQVEIRIVSSRDEAERWFSRRS